jgi:TldD protein
VQLAKAAAILAIVPVDLSDTEVHVGVWANEVQEDPFQVGLDEKIATLLRVDRALRKRSEIRVANGHMDFSREVKHFGSTEGAWIVQTRTVSGVGYSATAVGSGGAQTRSYPSGVSGQHATRGYEFVRQWPLVAAADRVAGEAVALLEAAPCPRGELDLILDGSQIALQVHESCGHPAELDRVLGSEANYEGKSSLTVDKMGSYRYGSAAVNLTADAVEPGGLGTYGFDDEGVRAGRWDLVRGGNFVGYLTSRETAAVVGLAGSQGAMRASGWNRAPLIRMGNVSLQPGEGSLDDLIADTKRGVLMETNRSWSIDNLRTNFQFGCELGWEIENGKRKRLIQNPTYAGITPDFWRSCDHVCGPDEWRLWGAPSCGKGTPGQMMGTGHGAAPARFRNVRVGVVERGGRDD